jgi:uncharacterized protein (DUF1330 family)
MTENTALDPVTAPRLLVAEIPDLVAARRVFPTLQDAVGASGGTVLGAALPGDVEVLEAGTRLAAVLIARFADSRALDGFWARAGAAAFAPAVAVTGSRAVSVQGVPTAGLPDAFLPTAANVQAPVLRTPPAYMLIQGSVTDPGPIGDYVSIIMPMLRERLGYYAVYATAPEVKVLHGQWDDQAFIVSRWPTLEAARDFWWCDRYQQIAIPVRTGHGAFTVLLLPGIAG